MSFYDEMRAMAADLLKPDTEGGLGQGAIKVIQITPGVPDPTKPWIPVTPTETVETVGCIGSGRAEFVREGAIITTDRAYMTVPTKLFTPRAGDVVEVGSERLTIIHVEVLPPHGAAVYQTLYCNR